MTVENKGSGSIDGLPKREVEVIEVGDIRSFLEGLKGCPRILALVEATLTPGQKQQYADTLREVRKPIPDTLI